MYWYVEAWLKSFKLTTNHGGALYSILSFAVMLTDDYFLSKLLERQLAAGEGTDAASLA